MGLLAESFRSLDEADVAISDEQAAAAVRCVMRMCPDDALDMLAALGLEA